MLRILFAFIIAFFIPAGNSSDHHNIVPEVDDLNTEQVRQIAICMLQFYKESLEKVTVSLQKDPIVYAFFEHKKGKKYKVQKLTIQKQNAFYRLRRFKHWNQKIRRKYSILIVFEKQLSKF